MSLGEEKKKDQMWSQRKSNSKSTIGLNSFTPLEKEWMRILIYFCTTLGKSLTIRPVTKFLISVCEKDSGNGGIQDSNRCSLASLVYLH